MSGASSLASARRRRAAPQQNEVNNLQNRIVDQGNQATNDGQKMAPLELLQLHDKKIANIQDNLEGMVVNLITEKLSKINFQAYNTAIKKLQEDMINVNNNITNIGARETPIETSQNLSIDYDKIKQQVSEYLSSNKNNTITDSELVIREIEKKTQPLSSTLASVIENIESITINVNNNIISKDKIEELLLEVNSLKVLLIKNQTLALESSNEINKLKDRITNLEIDVENINDGIKNNDFVEKDEITILKDELEMIHDIEKKMTIKENENNLDKMAKLTATIEE